MPPANPDPAAVVGDKDAPRAMLRLAGVDLAGSPDEAAHAPLRAALADRGWLDRLDPPAGLHGSAASMGLARVIGALRENPADAARQTLRLLAASTPYLDSWRRTDLLVEASEVVRPPGPELAALWTRELTPEGVHTLKVVRACLRNGSAEGLALVARAWGDARFDPGTKRMWARQYVLEVRDRDGVLGMVRDVTREGVAGVATRDLLGAVLDYRPLEWYGPHCTVDAPPWARATPDARKLVRELAATARGLGDTELDAAAARTIAELDALERGGT
jgi:hypothetical protein